MTMAKRTIGEMLPSLPDELLDDFDVQSFFLDLLVRNLKTGIRRRHSRVHRSLQKDFLQIAQFKFARQTRPRMKRKLFPPSQGRSHRQHQKSPGPPVEFRTRPDGSPSVARDQFLKLAREFCGCGDCLIDVRVTQHFTTQFHPGLGWVYVPVTLREQEFE